MKYSIADLGDANFVIDTKDTMKHGEDTLQWAYEVKSFFNRLYDYARKCTGAWGSRIALAWKWITGSLERKQKALNKILKKYKGAFVKSGVIYIPDNKFYACNGRKTVKKTRNWSS